MHVDRHPVAGAQVGGQRLEPVQAAGGQQQAVAACGQGGGEGGTNAGRRAGDEGSVSEAIAGHGCSIGIMVLRATP